MTPSSDRVVRHVIILVDEVGLSFKRFDGGVRTSSGDYDLLFAATNAFHASSCF
jgi:hypothetical protein